MPPIRTSSNLPFSKVRTSSGSSKRFSIVSLIGITVEITNLWLPTPVAARSENSVVRFLHHLRISRQREQREVFAVEMVFEIEDARKTGTGEIALVPGAIFLLRA